MIKIIIQSIEGREEFHMPVAEAADFIKDQCENKGIWAYLDGDYIYPNAIEDVWSWGI